MILPPRLRKFILTAHIVSSVGWIGAVIVFLVFGIVGLTSQDAQTVRAVYLVVEPAVWFALVPLGSVSLLTGIIQSLGTVWGLFRHYWVLFKLLINIFAIVVLLMYTETLRTFAGIAADPAASIDDLRTSSVVLHAVLALFLLLVATVLGVYKPRGLTPYGQRKQREERARLPSVEARTTIS